MKLCILVLVVATIARADDAPFLELIFKELNTNADSFLSRFELEDYFSRHHRKAQIEQFNTVNWALFGKDLRSMDKNHDSSLSQDEIVNPEQDLTSEEVNEESELFAFADVDGNGQLDATEYALYVTVFSRSEMENLVAAEKASVGPTIHKIMTGLDENKDGQLSLEEIEKDVNVLVIPLAAVG
jgi:hypothetical protein